MMMMTTITIIIKLFINESPTEAFLSAIKRRTLYVSLLHLNAHTFDVSNLFKYRPNIPPVKFRERSLTVGGRITVQLVSSLNTLVLEEGENMLLWLCSEAVESNLVIAMQ